MSDSITFTGEELRNIFLQQNEDMMNRQAHVAAENKKKTEIDKLDGDIEKGRLGILSTSFQILGGKSPDGMAFIKLFFESAQLLSASCKKIELETPKVKEEEPGIKQPAAAANTNVGINRAPASEEPRAGAGPLPGVKIAAGPAI